jgi:hypothetical protein
MPGTKSKTCDTYSSLGIAAEGTRKALRDQCINEPEGCEIIEEGQENAFSCKPKGTLLPDSPEDQAIRDAFKRVWGSLSFNEFTTIVLNTMLTKKEQDNLISIQTRPMFENRHSIYCMKLWNDTIVPLIKARYEDDYIEALPPPFASKVKSYMITNAFPPKKALISLNNDLERVAYWSVVDMWS